MSFLEIRRKIFVIISLLSISWTGCFSGSDEELEPEEIFTDNEEFDFNEELTDDFQEPVLEDNCCDRVVRYILSDNTPAYERADETSAQVGTYQAGDSIVVFINGEWAEVKENYYVRSSALSEKLVPRERGGDWKEPNLSAF